MSTPTFKPGDGATICHHTDRTACTVVAVSPSSKTLTLRTDTAVLDGWKPEIVPGGFAGHCVNNDTQRYRYAPDPNGAVHTARLRKDGSYRTSGGERVIAGRSHFRDYNF